MWNIVINIIACAIMVPFIVTWLIYKGHRLQRKTRLYAFHKAVAWSAILYILSVMMMLKAIFNDFFVGYIILFHLVCLTVLIIIQRVNHTEVAFKKACKIVWRLSFLLFFFLYIGLILIGIAKQLLSV
ncbi:hypothetical protein CFK37_16215 [Virgibacillus phasianinus]|uniref:DUF3397 domain-containing protein n=1 Tax=Virgibacillus phasianinus TaxID=2017483 RepID=A0A220U6I7_9BACI|nr:DUF3397 family protein [Virgibacillus phasianinus]ASK63592.1 hypothetical protein CFK37_16215 [Virgibacillus phasianinus]